MVQQRTSQGEGEMDFTMFLRWEKASRDTIDFKRCYVDMTGDLVAGLLLSQIVYWHLPDDQGKSKLRVKREGKSWLAKAHTDWWAEIRISKKQAMRAAAILEGVGLIETRQWRFNGLRTTHIRIAPGAFLEAWERAISASDDTESPQVTKGNSRELPKGTPASDQRVLPITETTTETKDQRIQQQPPQPEKAAEDVSTSQKPISQNKAKEREMLREMGVSKTVQGELLKLSHVDVEYLQGWLGWLQRGDHDGIRSVVGFAVSGIRNDEEAPETQRSKYAKYAHFNEAAKERERKRGHYERGGEYYAEALERQQAQTREEMRREQGWDQLTDEELAIYAPAVSGA